MTAFRGIDTFRPKPGAPKRIGISPTAAGVKVRGTNHFTECLIAMFPQYPDEDCTCHDDSPDWN